MNVFQISVAIALLTTSILGIVVFMTNPYRSANKGYAIQTIIVFCWLGSMFIGVMSTKADVVTFWIRMTLCFALFMPFGADILRFCITSVEKPFFNNWRRMLIWILSILPVVLIAWTPYFISGVKLPVGTQTIAMPQYRWGFALYIIQFNIAIITFVISLIKDLRMTKGILRMELQFIAFGSASALAYGSITSVFIPFFIGYSEVAKLLPYAILTMQGVAAYGIVAHRVMNVGEIIRRITAYTLLTVYLAVIYLLVFYFTNKVFAYWIIEPANISHLIATLIIAFSMAPANGRMQRVVRNLFADVQVISEKDALQRANSLAMSLGTTDELIDGFANILSDITGAEHIQIFFVIDQELKMVYPGDDGDYSISLSLDGPIVKLVNESLKPLSGDLFGRMKITSERTMVLKELKKMKSSLAIGFRTKGVLDGIILFGTRISGQVYSTQEQTILQIVCNEFGMALDNARLYTDVQNRKIYNDILLDSLVGGVIAVDTDGVVNVFNKQAQDIIGMLPEEIINRNISELPGPLAKALKDTLDHRHVLQDKNVAIVRSSGENIAARLSTAMFHGHTQDHIGAFVVINDITHLRTLEESVRRTDRLSSLGTLSAGIAHEIKNPLVSIKTFTQLLPEKYQDEEFRGTFFSLIGKEVSRIDKLVNRLLDFARPAKPSMSFVSLHGIIDECLQLTSEQMRTQDVRLILNLQVSNDIIVGDADLLKQVFVNFILNAIQCMEQGGELTVKTKYIKLNYEHTLLYNSQDIEDGIMLSFKDTGPGIPEEDALHVFDPFFTTKSTGTGLGLAVAHSIITEHDATITLNAVKPHGTSFDIVFPVRNDIEERI